MIAKVTQRTELGALRALPTARQAPLRKSHPSIGGRVARLDMHDSLCGIRASPAH
jgi:hypothetical protein